MTEVRISPNTTVWCSTPEQVREAVAFAEGRYVDVEITVHPERKNKQ